MIIIDVETTGMDYSKHSIIDIGAIDFHQPSNQFQQECRMWSGAEIDPKALKINGFTIKDIISKDKLSLKETIRIFLQWTQQIENRTIAGQNPDFDLGFLKATAKRYGYRLNLGHRKIDQHSLVYANHLSRGISPPLEGNVSNLNSDYIMQYVGLPLEPKPHKALNGAKWEAEAFSRLIYGRILFTEFRKYKIPNYLRKD